MRDPSDDLSTLWEWFAEHQCRGYSPLYERICLGVAHDREVLDLVRETPPEAHLPPALLAAVHDVLLAGFDHPLADVYAGRSDADPVPLFLEVCRTRRNDLIALLATRRIQTNDCGRSAVIGPGLTWLSARLDLPLALVDVGASAGLNLLCDRYRIDYGEHGATGPAGSPVEIECRVTGGDPPIARPLPPLVARVGIDRSPIDLADPDDARCLLACVWPDTGRLERTAASIRLAQQGLPPMVAGDAIAALPEVLQRLPAGSAAVVLTSWMFSYLGVEDRRRFLELLEVESTNRPVAWLSADIAGAVEVLGKETERAHLGFDGHFLGSVTFDRGACHPALLASVQQHGGWIDWRAPQD